MVAGGGGEAPPVPRLCLRQSQIQVPQPAWRQRRAEERQSLAAARLDERAHCELVQEPPGPGAHQPEELLRVGIALIRRQNGAAVLELVQHGEEVLLLFLSQAGQRAHQPWLGGVIRDELHRGGGGLLLAVRVITDGAVEVGERDCDPAWVGRRPEEAHPPGITGSSARSSSRFRATGRAGTRDIEKPSRSSRGRTWPPSLARPESAARRPITARGSAPRWCSWPSEGAPWRFARRAPSSPM